MLNKEAIDARERFLAEQEMIEPAPEEDLSIEDMDIKASQNLVIALMKQAFYDIKHEVGRHRTSAIEFMSDIDEYDMHDIRREWHNLLGRA